MHRIYAPDRVGNGRSGVESCETALVHETGNIVGISQEKHLQVDEKDNHEKPGKYLYLDGSQVSTYR